MAKIVSLSTPRWTSKGAAPRITIVDDQACPRCGAYWGHPDPTLDFPNRIKVDNDWKCYNPNCTCAYYRDGRVLEDKLSPEAEAEMRARVQAQVAEMTFGKDWVETSPNCWQLKPIGWKQGDD